MSNTTGPSPSMTALMRPPATSISMPPSLAAGIVPANLVAEMAIEDRVRTRLRHARFERGLTVAQVADRAGMAASTVSRLETGGRRLTLVQVERLAPALELSPDVL